MSPPFPTNFKYKVLSVGDAPSEDISKHFLSSIDFIKEAIASEGTVYVHCWQGMSRSATIVLAYVMKEKGLTFDQAYTLVQQARPMIRPNDGFVKQL
jgi:protein-tyrosine phosphatase